MNVKHLLKIFAISLVASSCATPPKVDVCISDPPNGFVCEGKESYELPFNDTGNYVCMSPTDLQKLVEYIKRSLESMNK